MPDADYCSSKLLNIGCQMPGTCYSKFILFFAVVEIRDAGYRVSGIRYREIKELAKDEETANNIVRHPASRN